jgi:hypothetical protein
MITARLTVAKKILVPSIAIPIPPAQIPAFPPTCCMISAWTGAAPGRETRAYLEEC